MGRNISCDPAYPHMFKFVRDLLLVHSLMTCRDLSISATRLLLRHCQVDVSHAIWICG
jgi:hypothetical protein